MNDGPAPSGQALAPAITDLLAPATDVRTVAQAAARIHAVHDVMRILSTAAQMQLMESCWVIRGHCPDRETFDAALAEHRVDEVLAPDEAWAMALTHDVQRRDRRLREMVGERPADAMRWVRGFVDAGAEARLSRLDARDEQVIGILRSPPRRMRDKVRALLEMEERERRRADVDAGDGAEHAPAHPPGKPLASQEWTDGHDEAERAGRDRLRTALDELRDCVHRMGRLAEEMDDIVPAAPAREVRRANVPALTDVIIGYAERIADAVAGVELDADMRPPAP